MTLTDSTDIEFIPKQEELEAQKSVITKQAEKSLVKQDTWCLIDNKWCIQWKKYVDFDNLKPANFGAYSTHPGQIDNSSLLQGDGSGEIKENLIDEIDYVLLPKLAWDLLVKWYGLVEGQQVIARKVIECGTFVKYCKVEVYLLEFKLCADSDLDHVVTKKFSRSDTIGHIEQEMKNIFNIPKEKETRLWNQYSHYTNEHLSNRDSMVQDAGLNHGQVLSIEVKNDDDTWPGHVKRLEVAVVRLDSYGFKVKQRIDFLDAIGDAILKIPEEEFVPRFSSTRIQDHYLIVSPVDELSKDWLLSAVPTMKLWGTNFHAFLASSVPNLYKALAWFSGKKHNAKLALKTLQRQNKGLESSKWFILTSSQKSNALVVMVVMEEESLIALRSCNFRPFYKSDKAKFKLLGSTKNKIGEMETEEDAMTTSSE